MVGFVFVVKCGRLFKWFGLILGIRFIWLFYYGCNINDIDVKLIFMLCEYFFLVFFLK